MSTKPNKKLIDIPTEIHFLITLHLSLNDLFSLLLTCKTLSSVAHQQLYSELHFGVSRNVFENRGMTLPRPLGVGDDFHIRINPERTSRLLETINSGKEKGFNVMDSLRYTRSLVIHEFLFHFSLNGRYRYHARFKEISLTFGRMVENGELPGLRRVFLNLQDVVSQDIEKLREALEKRFESDPDTSVSVALRLTASALNREFRPEYSLLSRINPGILTHLDVQFSIRNVWADGLEREAEKLGLTTETGNAKPEIEHLIKTLSRAPRLKVLRLESLLRNSASNPQYEIFDIEIIRKELERLQTTILGLEKLETLVAWGVIFHHSWFIIPPPSVRILSFTGPFSGVWYEEFAKQPLIGVEDLTIEYFDDRCGDWENSDGWGLDLEEVAVEGLKGFRFGGYDGPEGWVDGLIEKNKGLKVVRGDIGVGKMHAAGWRFCCTGGGDEYWLRRNSDKL
ncbi:hypothetical protein TWF679_004384 [Orbilia oligospora]|uniref:F-box domain-containing protein n=1 Tax=Orbilia oligospora TaxID=2813651 RepID=A0A8H8VE11_ORBOL|nr:hypothetical protein TWF679_004384 [Orbilia oligospora]